MADEAALEYLRGMDLTARWFQQLGLPAWILYTVALHAWAVMIGAKISGTEAALLTATSPIVSWIYWGLSLPDHLKDVSDLFLINLVFWLLSTSLVLAAWKANRTHRRPRGG